MAFLQGNTYQLPIQIKTPNKQIVTPNDVIKVQFVFGELEKFYGEDGVVTFDNERNCFIIPLTEEETFAMSKSVSWQVRVLYVDGNIDGSSPRIENIKDSITQTRLTPSETQEQNEEEQQEGEEE